MFIFLTRCPPSVASYLVGCTLSLPRPLPLAPTTSATFALPLSPLRAWPCFAAGAELDFGNFQDVATMEETMEVRVRSFIYTDRPTAVKTAGRCKFPSAFSKLN